MGHAINQGVAPDTLAIGCVLHTTSHVGEHVELPLVKTMVEGLNIALHSIVARARCSRQSTTRLLNVIRCIRWYSL